MQPRMDRKGTPTRRQPALCLLCPTNERSLAGGGEGYNQGSFVYLAKACGGWVFAGVNGVGCVDV